LKLPTLIVNKKCRNKRNYKIHKAQSNSQSNNVGKIFAQQLTMLRNITIIVVGNSKIEQYIEQKRKIEQSKIKTIICRTYGVLHSEVDA